MTPDTFLIRHQNVAWIALWLARTRPELAPLTGTVTLEYLEDGRPGSRTFVFRAETGEDEPQWDLQEGD